MKTLLVGINSKFIHSNLAIRSIQRYANDRNVLSDIAEFTINQSADYILDELIIREPDFVMFSCYIWNIELIKQISKMLKKVRPTLCIGCGGPEVSYDSEMWLEAMPEWDYIVCGEGEKATTELIFALNSGQPTHELLSLTYRNENVIVKTPQAPPMLMEEVPFPYEADMAGLEHRILYYETSRGCPYSCEYCLSSIEKGVRFRPLEKVFAELQFFLDNNVSQVKFVDRTFNAKKSHAMAIWQYLKDHDNHITNFHFELTADRLDDEMLRFLKTLRTGLVQFEVGVQSTNEQTILDVNRKIDFETLKTCVLSIKEGKNIHLHLDLIAGLPGEDYDSFGRSFNDVMAMRPEQLQLGFLKVLRGSMMHFKQKEYGLLYRDIAPYEILETNALSYLELRRLHQIEEVLELYYNSEQFTQSIEYLMGCFNTPFECFEQLARFFDETGLFHNKHNKVALYDLLYDFSKDHSQIDRSFLQILLVHDLASKEKPKKYPDFYDREDGTPEPVKAFYRDEANIQAMFCHYEGYSVRQIQRMTYMTAYPYDIIKWIEHSVIEAVSDTYFYYDYKLCDPLTRLATIKKVKL